MEPTERQQQLIQMLEKAYQFSLDIERHARQESAQSQLSPTDLAFHSRLVEFLRYELPQSVTGDSHFIVNQKLEE